MKSISISGTKRADLGKKATKEVRKQGLVPCVIYGEKKDANGAPEAVHFVVDEKQINKLVYTPDIYAVNLQVDGEEHLAILKEIQFHPVKDNVLHVDFYEVTPTKPIVMAVPIAPVGLAEGVRAGGKLVTMVRRLKVRATVDAIPEKLTIDVAHLGLGKSIKCGELSFEGLELVTPKEVVVVTVKMTRAAMGAAAAAAAQASSSSDDEDDDDDYSYSAPSYSAPSYSYEEPSYSAPSYSGGGGADAAIAAAKSYLGVPYVWGGESYGGVDCSGLTMLAWESAGVDLPHLSRAQYSYGTHVPIGSMEAGDLIFWSSNGTQSGIYHVAIYLGGGQMIEAPTFGVPVRITGVYSWGSIMPYAVRL